MKEVLFKFETEELFNKFMKEVILEKIANPSNIQLEYDFENNIGLISNIKNNEETI